MFHRLQYSVSYFLIFISIIIFGCSILFPEIYMFGINNHFLIQKDYSNIILQLILYNFLHGNILHLFFNILFLYYVGNKLEEIIGKINFIILFISSCIFIAVFIFYFWSGNTIGISWFLMTITTLYVYFLYKNANNDYKWGLTFIVIMIVYWLYPGISFLGHISWVLFWLFSILFLIILKIMKQKIKS